MALFVGEAQRVAAFVGDPGCQVQSGVGAEIVVGDVEVLVAAPEGACRAQSSGEGPSCVAAGAAKEQGQGVAERECAEEFVLVWVEGGEGVDLFVEPAGEGHLVGSGLRSGKRRLPARAAARAWA